MPFALPEYDIAFWRYVHDATRDMAQSQSELLGSMTFVEEGSTVGSRVQDRDGMDVELEPAATAVEMSTVFEDVRAGNLDAFASQIHAAGEEFGKQLVEHWAASMKKLTDATGNTVDAGGNLTFEKFYEMLDRMEWTVDENDKLNMPSLVMHPDAVKNLPEETPETKAKIAELLERKRKEAVARRRRRRLS
jgi:hypothetical protein